MGVCEAACESRSRDSRTARLARTYLGETADLFTRPCEPTVRQRAPFTHGLRRAVFPNGLPGVVWTRPWAFSCNSRDRVSPVETAIDARFRRICVASSDVRRLLHTHRSPPETATLAVCAAECVSIRTLSDVPSSLIRAGERVVLAVWGSITGVWVFPLCRPWSRRFWIRSNVEGTLLGVFAHMERPSRQNEVFDHREHSEEQSILIAP